MSGKKFEICEYYLFYSIFREIFFLFFLEILVSSRGED